MVEFYYFLWKAEEEAGQCGVVMHTIPNAGGAKPTADKPLSASALGSTSPEPRRSARGMIRSDTRRFIPTARASRLLVVWSIGARSEIDRAHYLSEETRPFRMQMPDVTVFLCTQLAPWHIICGLLHVHFLIT